MHRISVLFAVIVAGCGGGSATVKPTANAAPACDAKTCVELGDQHLERSGGAPKDAAKALEYYKKACDLNVGIGCGNASMMMVTGTGTPMDVTNGYALMIKACDLDDSRSCNNAGAAWSEGTNGASSVDHVKARTFYEKSCRLQNGLGCFNLGNVFRLGEGVPADPKLALGNFKLSCDLDEAKGCTELAILYFEGKVVPQDVAKARSLLEKGCKLGSVPACKNLEILKNAKP